MIFSFTIRQECPFKTNVVLMWTTLLTILLCVVDQSFGLEHIVGDYVWSIPPTPDFYSNWSSSHSFHPGDTLVFDFESEFHNVMQVSRREYENCTAEQPFAAFHVGPATVPLTEEGVFYFICSVADYCVSGQKLSVTVTKNSPALPPVPVPTTSAPLASLTPPTPVMLLPPKPPPDGHSTTKSDSPVIGVDYWFCFLVLVIHVLAIG